MNLTKPPTFGGRTVHLSMPRPPVINIPAAENVAKGVADLSVSNAARRRRNEINLIHEDYREEGDDLDAQDLPIDGLSNRVSQKYASLPLRMLQLLMQGGPRFEELYEPLRYQVSTNKDIDALLRYFQKGERLQWNICHSAGLTVDPKECQKRLDSGTVFRVRP